VSDWKPEEGKPATFRFDYGLNEARGDLFDCKVLGVFNQLVIVEFKGREECVSLKNVKPPRTEEEIEYLKEVDLFTKNLKKVNRFGISEYGLIELAKDMYDYGFRILKK